MSKAEKRERQRQNREVAREQRVAAEKKRRTRRSVGIFLAFLIPIAVVFGILKLTSGSDSSSKSTAKADKATTTTTRPTATTGATTATTTATPAKNPLLAPTGVTIDPNKTYTATIETTQGAIEISLDAKAAPVSVNNFVYLTKAGWYDGLRFNRAVRNFVIQTGSSNNTTAGGGPGYSVQAELPAGAYEVGSVAWAKSGAEPAGTAGSQFFIGTGSQVTTLPKDYGYIGKVTKGLDVAQKIMGFAPASGDGALTTPVTMTKVTITES